MCGILGQIQFRTNLSEQDCLTFKKANLALAHRGPDFSSTTKVNEQIVFGHNRLSIIDLAEESNQPFTKNNADFLVYNGEIYNYKSARSDLQQKGCSFTTNGDTEVLYEGFKRDGLSFLEQINGMFAFAFWSNTEQKLYIVRDRMGIKPLYILKNEHQLLFSSEIRPLLPYSKKDWNQQAIQEWLFYQTNPSNQTFFSDIELLNPGSWLKIDLQGNIESGSFFDLKAAFTSEKELSLQNLKDLVVDSVSSRLISDVPLGAFLSGGIDSSIVVAAMRKAHSGEIKTFSVGFDDPNFDERSFAKIIAEKNETNHQELVYSSNEIINLVPKAVESLDYPTGDGINTWLVSKATKEAGITVALSGLGGDELFGGYPSFGRNVSKKINSKQISALINQLPRKFITRNRELSKLALLNDVGRSSGGHVAASRAVFIPNQIEQLTKSNFKLPQFLEQTDCSYEELMQYSIPLLLRDTDQTSMNHALEVRVPLLDFRLVNYMASMKSIYRFDKNSPYPKKYLVDAFKEELPKDIYARKKRGFVLPFDLWLKSELKSYAKESLFDSPLSSLLDASMIQQIWIDYQNGKSRIKWSQVWSLVVLGRWMQEHKL